MIINKIQVGHNNRQDKKNSMYVMFECNMESDLF